ncbi:hypothetical protein [Pseudomonas sp. PD9R]|uniref:hypothetical protein n=1 Tax=Pseudomonas sp. PD9R TaxID=2853534 RepID=UPI001C48D4E8|nr:hypothetical protein [Pseudomonas sp. PD9R]MBV6825180.1 hypothetical protein [Pseudomonas sp. PD9R]
MYSTNHEFLAGPKAAKIKRSQPSAAPTGCAGTSANNGAISHDETRLQPLAPAPQPTTINKTGKYLHPPQVEGLDNRHSANRAITSDNSILAKLQAKSLSDECPFDCRHGIANTHGNLMLPARNKE